VAASRAGYGVGARIRGSQPDTRRKPMNEEIEEFELIDLGDAKEETRFGHFVPPTDGINELFV
jgi:hypothetical protein